MPERDVHLFSHDLASCCSDVVEVGIPELDTSLAFEPAVTDEEAVDYAASVAFPAGLPCGLDDLLGDDGAVGFGDLPFFELAGDDLFDLVLETESDFGDIFGGHCGFHEVVGIGGED